MKRLSDEIIVVSYFQFNPIEDKTQCISLKHESSLTAHLRSIVMHNAHFIISNAIVNYGEDWQDSFRKKGYTCDNINRLVNQQSEFERLLRNLEKNNEEENFMIPPELFEFEN